MGRGVKMKIGTLAILAAAFLCQTPLSASPAAPAMLSADGCHVCKQVCTKYGLSKGQNHCHIFSPESVEIYTKAAGGSAANSETMFAKNIIESVNYISLGDGKSGLFIGPITKDIARDYKVVSQGCGFGSQDVSVKKGPPSKLDKAFGAKVSGGTDGLYTIRMQDKDYLGIATADYRMVVVGAEDDIKCGGQFIKDNFYLYCKAGISEKKNVGSSGYCRTSLVRK